VTEGNEDETEIADTPDRCGQGDQGHPLDTTAAGDSFNAAYIAARMQGIGPKEAAQSGAKLAAEVIQHRGAIIKLV
jgi:sugar/nucleoside kinase (ribokinase family)